MKRCATCHKDKPESAFNKRSKSHDGLQARCRDCSRDWYLQNKQSHGQNVRKRSLLHKEQINDFILDYLESHPCVDCGETDVLVLDFDHVTDDKVADISYMVRRGWSIKTIQKEIEKCEVRCANDHRRRTAKQFGWYRLGGNAEPGAAPDF